MSATPLKRRAIPARQTRAERAIGAAMDEVSDARTGRRACPQLEEAFQMLAAARDLVSDFVDGVPAADPDTWGRA